MEEEEAQAQWQSNLSAALPIVAAALQAVTGPDQTAAVVYEPPTFLELYGPWLAAGGGALLLVLLLRN